MSASAQAVQVPSDPTLAGRTVLVIEDHRDSRDMLRQLLQSLRAHVLLARNIDEAERELSFQLPHLIICDMKLPDGTGLEFINWLRSQSQRIKAIPSMAITGYEQHFPVNAATGFDAYLRKPIDVDRFSNVAVALARGVRRIDEEALRERARAKLEAGDLPKASEARLWAGPSLGRACAVCDVAIARGDMEYKAQFPALRAFRFHRPCFAVWQLERLRQ